jgi:SAM-dependent methyltransferase
LIESEPTPQIAALRALLAERYPAIKGIVARAEDEFGAAWSAGFEEVLKRLFGDGERLALAARGYAHFVMDLLRRQRKFEEDRRYAAKTYEEAAQEVYYDEDYMLRQYLPGLLLSHYLWPHHVRQLRFFESAFVETMRAQGAESFVEVGVGTGIYSRVSLQQLPGVRGLGVDISPASRAFAQAHIEAFGLQDRYAVVLQDVMADALEPCRWLVCVEVLEHLEDPVSLLVALREALPEDGRAFITTALNAANVDHIHLYESTDDVLAHLDQAGFALEQGFHAPAHRPVKEGIPVPAVAAFIVS